MDLKFDALLTPPAFSVGFTDRDALGQETHGNTRFVDADAAALLAALLSAKTTQKMLDALSAAIDTQAAAVKDPGSVAAKVTAAAEADRKMHDALDAAAKAKADGDDARAKLVDLNAQIAAAQAKLAAKP